MRLRLSRKGVSEIIGALLVICITIFLGTLLGAYASGLFGSLFSPSSQPYTEELTLDYYTWTTVANGPTITIRNDGAATITLADFFLEGVKNTTDLTPSGCPSPNPYVLSVQFSCTLTFPVPSGLTGTLTSGTAYFVKLVAKDGTIFTFSCIAGSYTH